MGNEYVNEEYGVPAVRDGIPQDPNNHNGPKPGSATADLEDSREAERAARVEAAKDSEKPETPEAPRQRGKAGSDKPETR